MILAKGTTTVSWNVKGWPTNGPGLEAGDEPVEIGQGLVEKRALGRQEDGADEQSAASDGDDPFHVHGLLLHFFGTLPTLTNCAPDLVMTMNPRGRASPLM